jgi:MFS family permease
MPVWAWALGATLLMQTMASFVSQTLPVIAPLVTSDAGLSPERIGNLSSLVSFGTVMFLLMGGPVLVRLGPVRTLQVGAAISVLGLGFAATGWLPALLLASFILGVGYGPSPPAGSRILARTAPKEHRTLIFSVKQAGAPAGGVLAGLITAPIAAAWGWQAALIVVVAAALGAAALIQPLRAPLDVERDPARKVTPRELLRPATLAAPVAALGLDPMLPVLTALAISFAMVQGSLFSFSVTWMVEARGLSLVEAGSAYAAMQGAGVVARIFLGWLADRTGTPTRNLVIQGFAAAVLVAAYANLPLGAPAWALWLAAAAAGFVGASWNGIYLAEVARLAPSDRVGDATSGSTLFTFLGYVVGPSVFSMVVTLTGSWTLAFGLVSAQVALVSLAVGLRLRSPSGARASP